ncbi:MAG: TolC family protein [Acidobacteriota bacterium]|nr:TolC family protein [Acidobacteriota bacterium]
MKRRLVLPLICLALLAPHVFAQQAQTVWISEKRTTVAIPKYLDLQNGKTADELVAYALANNAELAAMRSEVTAAEALVGQAGLRPNPSLEVSGTRQIGGMGDNSLMAQGSLPLELGGRRGARIRVAERELEIRKLAVAERERQLAAEVRVKFGESLAAIYKLRFTEEMLALANENYKIVAARVEEGRRPPLEQNVETVELNRLRVMRETNEASAEIRLLELRNAVGMTPEEPLQLSGSFEDLLVMPPPQTEAVENALARRPDLQGARAVEQLTQARIEQARAEGRLDAEVMAGYQRMQTGFPLSGVDEMGNLQPIENRMNFFTFGVRLNLPVRNRNQGMIAAAVAEEEAARRRREFGELTIRREVAAAYTRFDHATRAMQIYRVGVREQAAENLNVVRQTYELGAKPLFDYIAEQRRFIETESGFIDAQLETYSARVEILRATAAPELK